MHIIIWSKPNCPNCILAKRLVQSYDIEYEERIIGDTWTREQLLEAVPTVRTVPAVFVDGEYIGSYEDLRIHLNHFP